MKHLIIEGPDRVGKNSIISNLIPYCQNMVVTHFSTPEGNTDLEKRNFQEESFKDEFRKSEFFLKNSFFKEPKKGKLNLVVWNRAHLGEFVYGKLYRETNPEEWVMKIEEDFGYDKSPDVYLLLLTADPEFLSQNDDGLSFSSTAESRKKELDNFKNAFNLSQIKKKREIKVDHFAISQGSEGIVDGNGIVHVTSPVSYRTMRFYRPQKDILQEVLEFLNT